MAKIIIVYQGEILLKDESMQYDNFQLQTFLFLIIRNGYYLQNHDVSLSNIPFVYKEIAALSIWHQQEQETGQ